MENNHELDFVPDYGTRPQAEGGEAMTNSEVKVLLELAEKAKGHPVPKMADHECVWIDCEFRTSVPALCRELLAARALLMRADAIVCRHACGDPGHSPLCRGIDSFLKGASKP
jgi:hypothetical protein